jgi:hypothetical protein
MTIGGRGGCTLHTVGGQLHKTHEVYGSLVSDMINLSSVARRRSVEPVLSLLGEDI